MVKILLKHKALCQSKRISGSQVLSYEFFLFLILISFVSFYSGWSSSTGLLCLLWQECKLVMDFDLTGK